MSLFFCFWYSCGTVFVKVFCCVQFVLWDIKRHCRFREALRPRGGAARQRKDVEEGPVFMCCSLCYCASVCLSLLLQAFASVPLCVGANAYISPSLSLLEYDRWIWHDRVRDAEREGPVRALHAPTCKTIIFTFFHTPSKFQHGLMLLFCVDSG